jgi:hypothetical protein
MRYFGQYTVARQGVWPVPSGVAHAACLVCALCAAEGISKTICEVWPMLCAPDPVWPMLFVWCVLYVAE